MKVHAYLTFPGNCKEAMEYYKGIFGGDFRKIQTWEQSGSLKGEEAEKYDEFKHLIWHCSLPLTPTFTIMAADYHPIRNDKTLVVGNNNEIILIPDSKADADRFFTALSDGGSVQMPMQDMFWGCYSGHCTDKFGIGWLIDAPSNS